MRLYLVVTLAISLLLPGIPALCGDAPPSENKQSPEEIMAMIDQQRSAPLVGIKKMGVWVAPLDMHGGSAVQGFDYRALQDMVEVKLRTIGVEIQPTTTISLLSMPWPCLSVVYSCTRTNQRSLVYTIDVTLMENAALVRDSSVRQLAHTWSVDTLGICAETEFDGKIRDYVTKKMDMFCNDYLRANPKK